MFPIQRPVPLTAPVVVASRSSDHFYVTKIRLDGGLVELYADALAMSDAEAGELFAKMGVQSVAELVRATAKVGIEPAEVSI